MNPIKQIVRRAQMGWRFTAQVDTQARLWLEARGNRHVRRDSAWHFLCLDGASTGRGESRGSRAADLAGDTVTGGFMARNLMDILNDARPNAKG